MESRDFQDAFHCWFDKCLYSQGLSLEGNLIVKRECLLDMFPVDFKVGRITRMPNSNQDDLSYGLKVRERYKPAIQRATNMMQRRFNRTAQIEWYNSWSDLIFGPLDSSVTNLFNHKYA